VDKVAKTKPNEPIDAEEYYEDDFELAEEKKNKNVNRNKTSKAK